MKSRTFIAVVVCMACALATPAWADWDPDQASKWVQFPDLSVMGIDVNASMPYILADDFECTTPGPITDIHIWGSWLDDALPDGNPHNVSFTLSIHKDIPDPDPGNPDTYSMPGEVLWVWIFQPGDFVARIWQDQIEEGWMDPPESYSFPADWTCWQYNFFINEADAFYQEGTPDEPMVYWLDVQAEPQGAGTRFGWKTSVDHWNDDAVWGQGQEPYPGPWYELRYPPGHEMQGQSIDLAFVITTIEEELDFGDAPDSAVALGYPTWLASNGARHVIAGPWLGDATDVPDSEPDGQSDPNALGDDNNDGNDDEDGVVIPPLVVGVAANIAVQVGGAGGFVDAWIDWNGDQVWQAGEQISNAPMAAGPNVITVTPPASSVVGQTFARFRISSAGGLTPVGQANDGEVEDYELYIEEGPQEPEADLGDAPDSSNNYGSVMTAYSFVAIPAIYPTVYNDGSGAGPYGPIHWQPRVVAFLGDAVTLEEEADIGMDEDPTNNIDPPNDTPDLDLADDGVQVPLTLPHCDPQTTFDYTVTIVDTSLDLFVNVWFDWTRDGDWDDAPQCPGGTAAPEWAVQNQLLAGFFAPGQYTITTPPFLPWHPTDPPEEIWMRITLSEQPWQSVGGAPGFGGSGPDVGYNYGETEDYIFLPRGRESKWSQYPHGPFEGFDVISDLWWHEDAVKWEQLPNPLLPGIHAHDYYMGADIEQIILADDWLCEGGVVTDFHWWGTVEDPGAGIREFHLSIHYESGNCLPMDPAYWEADIPITQITVTPTGVFNSSGLEIMRYDYDLPVGEWFYQEEGQTYWFDVSAISIDPQLPFIWLWQESARVLPPFHTLCPAAQKIISSSPFWQPILWSDDRYSDMAFRVTSQEVNPQEVNKVVADDFISDGRPIEGVRWWGSYIDPEFEPDQFVEPYIIDGWIISFHWADDGAQDPTCPPDLMLDGHPTALGLYFAPADKVQLQPMGYQDCQDHNVYEYAINLADCCLLCSEIDPRFDHLPAEEGAFMEIAGFRYWLDIQAVVGVEWDPDSDPPCQMQLTGHQPSPHLERHFWGWHTSKAETELLGPLDGACTGRIVDFSAYPPGCWDYGEWEKVQWECPTPAPDQVDQAFELLAPVCNPMGDVNGDGVLDINDIPCFIQCLLGNPTPGYWCGCADMNLDGTVNGLDIQLFVDDLVP